MNKSFNIIPTPKYCKYTPGKNIAVSKVCVIGKAEEILQHAMTALNDESPFGYTIPAAADLLIYADFSKVPAEYLDADDLKNFEEKFAPEQGYILKTLPNGQIAIMAQSQTGCAYAVMTLIQMLGQDADSFTIRDNPDFCMRGIKWLIWAETGAWAYDFGDGIEAIERRMKRNIDLLFRYKINYVFADKVPFFFPR